MRDGLEGRKYRYHWYWKKAPPHKSNILARQGQSNIMANILVVDDEHGIRDLLWEILNDEGHHVELAENAAQARSARERGQPDLVLLDIWMPDTDGVSLLKEWSVSGMLTIPVIMMSGHGTIDTAVEATKMGAMAFLEKPVTLQKLLKAVEQGLTRNAVQSHNARGVNTVNVVVSREQPTILDAEDEFDDEEEAELPDFMQSFMLDKPLREARDAFEKAYFEYHLHKEQGSMTRVADKTGLERTHLYRKLKQLGVDLSREKRNS
jgi:DNA-binding NtrC family response regulator